MNPQRSKAELLEELLEGHDEPCPACGYNLRGLRTGACPECDSALELRVGLVHPRQAAFITGLVGASMGLGLSALLVLYAGLLVLRFGVPGAPDLWVFVGYNGAAGLVQGAAVLAWIKAQKRLRLAGPAFRWSLAAAGWGISLVNLFIFSVLIK